MRSYALLPFHGICPGNGAGPSGWATICSTIIKDLSKQECGIKSKNRAPKQIFVLVHSVMWITLTWEQWKATFQTTTEVNTAIHSLFEFGRFVFMIWERD